jgi:hypothetical protein
MEKGRRRYGIFLLDLVPRLLFVGSDVDGVIRNENTRSNTSHVKLTNESQSD